MGYFTILAAIPGFFLSSFILMLLWGVIAPELGIETVGYPMAMLITITIWLVVAPLAAVGRKAKRGCLQYGAFKQALFTSKLSLAGYNAATDRQQKTTAGSHHNQIIHSEIFYTPQWLRTREARQKEFSYLKCRSLSCTTFTDDTYGIYRIRLPFSIPLWRIGAPGSCT